MWVDAKGRPGFALQGRPGTSASDFAQWWGLSIQPFFHAIEPNMTMTDQLERDFFFIVHMFTDVSEQLPMYLATFAANGRLAANGRAVFR